MTRKRIWEAVNGAVYTTGTNPVRICTTNYNGLPAAEDMANAFLIAAAPALKAALKRFVDECGGNPPDWLREAFAEAEDALLEAEGRA